MNGLCDKATKKVVSLSSDPPEGENILKGGARPGKPAVEPEGADAPRLVIYRDN